MVIVWFNIRRDDFIIMTSLHFGALKHVIKRDMTTCFKNVSV